MTAHEDSDMRHSPLRLRQCHAGMQLMALTMALMMALLLELAGFSSRHANAAVLPALQPPSTLTAVAPIAVPEILARAEEEQQLLDVARQLLAAPPPVERLRRALDDITAPVNAKLLSTSGVTLHGLPIMRLESLARHWEFDAHRFARWEAEARRAFAPYADSAVQLAQRRAVWSATRAAGLLDGLPPAIAGRVDAVLAQIDACEAALGDTLARQFELSERASALKVRIRSGRDDVAAAIDDIDRRLLRTDVPPLWQGLGDSGSSRASLDALHRGLDIETRFARDYNAAHLGNQQALRVLQLLSLLAIVGLALRDRCNRRVGKGGVAGEERLADAANSDSDGGSRALPLRRPLSAWLLLAMLSVLVFEPDAPLLVQEFALVGALVPVLRLLPADTARWLGMPPAIAIGLYALDRFGVAAVADTGIYRLFLLALNILALGLTVWMLRQRAAVSAPHAPWLQRARRPLAWAVFVTLTVAVLCNIAGNVSLAEMLTSGVIDSGYMALVLYASVAVCRGLLHAVLNQPRLAGRQLVRRQGPVLQAVCERLLVLAALAGWLLYSLHRFRMLRPLHSAGAAVMESGIEVGEVSLHLGDVLVFVFSSWLALWVARGVRRLLRDELPGHSRLPRGVGNSIASLSYYALLIVGMLVALSAAGFRISQLALVFGALGVGIGFGLQNVVNNFVSGLILMFERSIQPGDVVDAAGISGTVREIGLRATTIRTADGADAVVPNGLLLSGNLTNWTMFDRSRRFEIAVGVAYGAEPQQVLSLLRVAAIATPGVAAEPAPVVLMTGYGDSALNFIVRAWTADVGHWMQVRGDLLERVLLDLQAAGIEIPYQQIDINLRKPPDVQDRHEGNGGNDGRAGPGEGAGGPPR